MVGSVLLVLIVELLNSAIESLTDRVSLENHELAKRAKDMGSAAVFLAYVNCIVVWGIILFSYWLLMRGFAGMNLGLPAVVPFLAVIFVSAAVPTPGMAGSLDLASKYALTGLFSVSARTAVAFTILFHFLLLLAPIVLGLVALWREGLSFKVIGRLRRKDELPAMH